MNLKATKCLRKVNFSAMKAFRFGMVWVEPRREWTDDTAHQNLLPARNGPVVIAQAVFDSSCAFRSSRCPSPLTAMAFLCAALDAPSQGICITRKKQKTILSRSSCRARLSRAMAVVGELHSVGGSLRSKVLDLQQANRAGCVGRGTSRRAEVASPHLFLSRDCNALSPESLQPSSKRHLKGPVSLICRAANDAIL